VRAPALAALATLLLAAAAASAGSLLDAPPPEPAVARWVVADAPPPLKGLRGRCVLLEITDPGDLVCQGLASRTRELARRGAGRDLAVITVATGRGGDEELAKDFAKRAQYDWPVGVDRKGETWLAWGAPNLPWCLLVAPDGRVLWEGNPGALENAVLDAFLDRARLWRPDEIAKPVRPAAEAFSKGRFGSAWKKAEEASAAAKKRLASGDASAGAEEKDAALVRDGVDFIAGIRLGIAARLAKDRHCLRAREMFEGIATSCAGTPWEAKAKEELAKLAADKRAQAEIDSTLRLEEILAKVRPPSRVKVKQAIEAVDAFIALYDGFVSAERAREERKKLETLLERW
jgi:hypothetical protein